MTIYCKCCILTYFNRFYFDCNTIFYDATAKDIFLAKDGKEEAVGNDTVTFMTARTKIKLTGLCVLNFTTVRFIVRY